jgi:hypothetical protein
MKRRCAATSLLIWNLQRCGGGSGQRAHRLCRPAGDLRRHDCRAWLLFSTRNSDIEAQAPPAPVLSRAVHFARLAWLPDDYLTERRGEPAGYSTANRNFYLSWQSARIKLALAESISFVNA